MKRRLLPGQPAGPELEFWETEPARPNGKPPILCLHGAFGGAWMWTESFLPALAGLGRRAAAVSLRGHGGSEGRHAISDASLADYRSDALRAIDALAEPPIIVGHSMGALLAQRLLGQRPLRALVLLAPLPPEGMFLITPRLLMTAPRVWLGILNAISGADSVALDHVRDTVFSDRLAPADIDRYLSLMVVEGRSALLECHLPLPVLPAFLCGVPTLVVEAGDDRLVPSDAALRTSLYHGGDRHVVEGAGHLVHLEPAAADMVRRIVEWLEGHSL